MKHRRFSGPKTLALAVAFILQATGITVAEDPPDIKRFTFNGAPNSQRFSIKIKNGDKEIESLRYNITADHKAVSFTFVDQRFYPNVLTAQWRINASTDPPIAVGTLIRVTLTAWNGNPPPPDMPAIVEEVNDLRAILEPERTSGPGTVVFELVLEPYEILDLDRPSHDPSIPITDVTGTWNELWPEFPTEWEGHAFSDVDNDGELSVGDGIVLSTLDVAGSKQYRVQDKTIALNLVSDVVLGPTYFDYWGFDDDLATAMFNPCQVGTDRVVWAELHPDHGQLYECCTWTDNDNDSRISAGDGVSFKPFDANACDNTAISFGVAGVSTDIEAVIDNPCTVYPYGDLNHDGFVDVGDILRVLDGFSDPAMFPEADIAPCGGDGNIDVGDVLAVLDAFAGIAACPECS